MEEQEPRYPSCTDVGISRCSTCHDVYYCSEVCREADEPFHDVLCEHFKSISDRPSPEMCRVIHFKQNYAYPELSWWPVIETSPGFESIDCKRFVDGPIASYKTSVNGLTGAKLSVIILLLYGETAKDDFRQPNFALASVPYVGSVADHFKGPLSAYCYFESSSDNRGKVVDIGMKDFSDLMACLVSIKRPKVSWFEEKLDPTPWIGPKVEGVRIKRTQKGVTAPSPEIEPVLVPRHHPLFREDLFARSIPERSVSVLSKRACLNLALWKEGPKSQSADGHDYSNPKAAHLLTDRDYDDRSAKFGHPEKTLIGGNAKDVLVAKIDREPLDVETVEAFADFCRYHVGTHFAWQREKDIEQHRSMERGDSLGIWALKAVKPKKWASYLEKWREAGATLHQEVVEHHGIGDIAVRLGRMNFVVEDREKLKTELSTFFS